MQRGTSLHPSTRWPGWWKPRWPTAVGAAIVLLSLPAEEHRAEHDTVITSSVKA